MPHPGWRHRVPAGRVVLGDQGDALARAAELVDAEVLWRADRRATTTAVLRRLVFAMSWELGPRRGLVAGVTHAQLAEAASCSPRTVSRVVAWAIASGLLVCVESGATAEFLGTETNRAPSYVLTALQGGREPRDADLTEPAAVALVAGEDVVAVRVVDEVGDPPASCVQERSPCSHRGQNDHKRQDHGSSRSVSASGPGAVWGWRDQAQSPTERAAAADTLLERLGIGGVVVRWRARALLGPWFAEGWSLAELLHAAGHHPDDPTRVLGDVGRGARAPLAVLAARLRPWVERRDALPLGLGAVDPVVRRRRAAELAEADPAPARGHVQTSSAAARAAARAHFAHATDRRRRSRSGPGRGPGR